MEHTVLSSHFEFDQEAMGRFADALRVAAAGSEDVLDHLFRESALASSGTSALSSPNACVRSQVGQSTRSGSPLMTTTFASVPHRWQKNIGLFIVPPLHLSVGKSRIGEST